MNKKNLDIVTCVLSFIFVTILPFVTMLYLLKWFSVFLLIALIINIVAIPIVGLCLIMELKKRKENQ
jgi:hypothetical protein